MNKITEFLANLNIKKIIQALIILVMALVMALGLYFLIFRPSLQPATNINFSPLGDLPATGPEVFPEGPVGGLPDVGTIDTGLPGDTTATRPADVAPVAQGDLTLAEPVTDRQVTGPEISTDGNGLLFYEQASGKFYRLSPVSGEKILLSDQTFFEVKSVTWSPDKSKAVLVYPDNKKQVYDFTSQRASILPSEAEAVQFDPGSQELAFMFVTPNPDNNWLVTSAPDGTGATAVEHVGDRSSQVQIAWSPDKSVVALYAKAINLSQEEVFFIGLKGENYRSAVVQGTNFTGTWSPQGDRILYHTVLSETDFRPNLWVMDASSAGIGRNNFNLALQTWVEKCVWSKDARTVYCAVPTSLTAGAGLEPSIARFSEDEIWRVDLNSGLKNKIAIPTLLSGQSDFSIKQLFLSGDEQTLYFWDERSKLVYSLQLK